MAPTDRTTRNRRRVQIVGGLLCATSVLGIAPAVADYHPPISHGDTSLLPIGGSPNAGPADFASLLAPRSQNGPRAYGFGTRRAEVVDRPNGVRSMGPLRSLLGPLLGRL